MGSEFCHDTRVKKNVYVFCLLTIDLRSDRYQLPNAGAGVTGGSVRWL